MKTIKFNSDYPKLHGQKTAILVAVTRIKIDDNTPPELIEYDTKKADGTYYKLENGIHLQLIFLGDKSIPFCTIRSAKPAHKVEQYKSLIGKPFAIIIEEPSGTQENKTVSIAEKPENIEAKGLA